MKYAWIASNKAHWPITLACEVLGVSASGYFEHGRRKKFPKPSKPGAHKRMSDEALLAHIRAIHAEVKGEYGWPKMWKELVARGHRVGKERVRRLMQLHGIRARCKRKFVVTSDSKHHLPIAPDLVQRKFTPTAPNQVWTGDITYIATDEGWLYLAAVIDLFSRQVVGWSMQPHMQSSLVTDALKMAWFRRQPAPGLIFHSDRGSQGGFNRWCKDNRLSPSMSRRGNCWDNAVAESFFSNLKSEQIKKRIYQTRAEAKSDIFDYIEGFYNRVRRHKHLDQLSPYEFERQRQTAL